MMKKLMLAAVATSMIATPVLAAPAQSHGRGQTHTVVKHKPNGTTVVKHKASRAPVNQYRKWNRGQRFDSRYARNYRQVDYRQFRTLKAPPRGYRYVRSDNDVVLVGITSGIIAAVFANLIR